MALSTETENWLADLEKSGGLSVEQMTSVRSAMNDKADSFVKGSVLRQSDYSRKQDELQRAQTEFDRLKADVEDKATKTLSYRDELGQWKSGVDTQITSAIAAQTQAETKLAIAVAKLKTLGTQYGVDVNLEENVEDKQLPNGFDPSKYVTTDKMGQNVREMALLDAMAYDIGNEHQRLFGTPLPKMSELVNESLSTNVPLTKLWEEKYKVPDKRGEIAEAGIQARINEAVVAERAKLATQGALPGVTGMRGQDYHSPVLIPKTAAPVESTTPSGSGVSAAIAAFNAGTYTRK